MNHHLSLAALGILSASPLCAQFTTPPGFLTVEGDYYSIHPGLYPNGRVQFVDGELPTGAWSLTRVAYRADYRVFHAGNGMGRTWKDVTLHLSDGDFAKMTRTFSQNVESTPTRVFSGSLTWPTLTGRPPSKPAPWAYAFPFQGGPYVHAGTADLLLDYRFSGGALQNSAPWTTKIYYLDSQQFEPWVRFASNLYRYVGASGTGNCADSSVSSTNVAANMHALVELYHRDYVHNPDDPAFAGKVVLLIGGYWFGKNGSVIQALGLKGLPGRGVPLTPFFGCYNLIIDPTDAVFVPHATDASGHVPGRKLVVGDIAKLAQYGAVPIWSQAAWSDSATGQPKLSAATRCIGDARYALDPPVNRKMIYASNPANPTGSSPSDLSINNPIARYN